MPAPSPPPPLPLLKYSDVARITRLSERTLRSYVNSGELPAVRFGRRATRFDPRDVARFVELRRVA